MSKESYTRGKYDSKGNLMRTERSSLRTVGSYNKRDSRFPLFSLVSSVNRVLWVGNVRRIVGQHLKTDQESLYEFPTKEDVEEPGTQGS